MHIRVISWVLDNNDALNDAIFAKQLVILFIRVDQIVLDSHVELVDLEAECLSNLESHVANSLLIGEIDVLLYHIRPEDDEHLHLVEPPIAYLGISLDVLFSFVAIQKFGKKLEGVAYKSVVW